MNKKYQFTVLFTFLSLSCFAHDTSGELQQTVIRNGIGLGSVIAAITSWDRNKSVLLAIVHGIFSWLYVVYYQLTRK